MRATLVADNARVGIFVGDSDATIEDSVVLVTRDVAGRFGDGLSVLSELAAGANVWLTRSHIRDSSRAGVSNFGAFVSLGGVRIACAAFELEGERHVDQPFRFEDRGDNGCGCPVADGRCVAVSAGIEPPEPLAPIE